MVRSMEMNAEQCRWDARRLRYRAMGVLSDAARNDILQRAKNIETEAQLYEAYANAMRCGMRMSV